MKKKILFLLRNAPYGKILSQEAIDVLLMCSTFDQPISIVFLEDGIFQLKIQQNPEQIGLKNFTAALKALPLYGIENIYVDEESLNQRGLAITDLMLSVTLLNRSMLAELMRSHDVVFNF